MCNLAPCGDSCVRLDGVGCRNRPELGLERGFERESGYGDACACALISFFFASQECVTTLRLSL